MMEYNKVLVEVHEVLRHLSKEDIEKIPQDIFSVIEENKDKKYEWKYDETKSLKEQTISRDTIIVLSYINMEYLLNNEQKELMQQIHEENKKINQIHQNSQKIDLNDIFKNKLKTPKVEELEIKDNNMKMQIYKENIFTKILKRIRQFFSRT